MKKKPKHTPHKRISKAKSEIFFDQTAPRPGNDFMKLAGCVEGSFDLSSRKGFQR